MSKYQKPYRGIQLNRSHPLSRGLVGAWVMNEGSGDIIHDLSGNGRTSTLTGNSGFSWVPGGINFADGSDEYFTITPGINLTGAFTVATRFTAYVDYYPAFCGGGTGSYLRVNSNWNMGVIRFKTETGFQLINTTPPTEGVAANWVFARNGSGVTSCYLDGVDDSTGNTQTGTFSIDKIGTSYSIHYWDGDIEYLYVYNRTLTPSEIAWLHREPYAMFEQKLAPAMFYLPTAGENISVPTARLVWKGLIPTISATTPTQTVNVPTAELVYNGLTSQISVKTTISATTAKTVAKGLAPTITAYETKATISVPTAKLVYKGLSHTINTTTTEDIPTSKTVVNGLVPTISAYETEVNISVPTAKLVYKGLTSTINTTTTEDVPVARLVWNGLTATIIAYETEVNVSVPTGELVFNGLTPTIYIPGVGWTGKIMGISNPSKINGISVANISKVNGIT